MPSFARPTRLPMATPAGRRGLAPIAVGILLAMGATLAGVLPAALAAPGSNKVTICHRTHSVTNPYRMITVSASAADGAGRSDHTHHDEVYSAGGRSYPVFTRGITYPANQKWWGDIIPPVRSSPGLNWTAAGAQAIYTGAGDSFGLCGRMSAKEFYDTEVAAGIAPAAALADLDAQSSREDAELLQSLGVAKFADLDPSDLPDEFTSAPDAPEGVRPPASLAPETGKQKIAVFVWYDLNRNGAVDAGEEPASGIPVSLGAVVDLAVGGFAPASTFVMSAGQVLTDANGLVTDESIAAGQWEAAALAPQSTEVTYDSEGTVDDGAAVVDIPANSAGFAWIGLVPAADGGTEPTPSEPVPSEPTPSEPAPSEPIPSEPTPSEPAPSEPIPSEPTPSEPTPTEPTPSEPTPTEPTPSEPTPSEPTPSDPAPTVPGPSEPETAEPETGDVVNDGGPGDADGSGAVDNGTADGRAGSSTTVLARTGGPLDAATLAVGAGALVVLGVALARRASSARRRASAVIDSE